MTIDYNTAIRKTKEYINSIPVQNNEFIDGWQISEILAVIFDKTKEEVTLDIIF